MKIKTILLVILSLVAVSASARTAKDIYISIDLENTQANYKYNVIVEQLKTFLPEAKKTLGIETVIFETDEGQIEPDDHLVNQPAAYGASGSMACKVIGFSWGLDFACRDRITGEQSNAKFRYKQRDVFNGDGIFAN